MSSIDIIFFDAGETLIHPHPSFPELFAQVCAENDIEVDPDRVADVQGRLAPHLVDIAEDTGVTAPSLDPDDSRTFWTYLYRRLLEELDIEGPGLTEVLYARFSDSASYKIFDDVLPALSELEAAGYRLGLISNFEGWLENILVEQQLGETFEVSVISGLEGVEKPDPHIYRLAVERAGVDPSRSVHVGDSPVMDVRPAREVGINAILLDRTGRYMNSGYSTIASLEELPEVVTKL
ncbi:MAG TPA: HAD-IA family hydrolase [Actinomycetota bacterium]|nr:HAD-IA family hydrolase [Actinomycetota bacterium]